MKLLLYSRTEREEIDIPEITELEEPTFWDKLARRSEIFNGWTNGCIRLVNTAKTADNFDNIEKEYISRSKRILRLNSFRKRVVERESFYVFNKRHVNLPERLAALEVLKCNQNNYLEWVNTHNHFFDIWSRISFEFDILAFGIDGVPEIIGETDKSKRICRFCNNSGRNIFSNKSHAIPEALGNKLLVCAEECDNCNKDLKGVEENFVHLMDFRRAMYRISGKDRSGSPKIKGKNYTIYPDEHGNPVLYLKESIKPKRILEDGSIIFKFDHYESIVDQDIYRALAKMVIDVLPADRLHHFNNTINWIRKKNTDIIPDALPSVMYGELPTGNMFEQPVLYLFFRKKNDDAVPYCTALLFTTDIAYQFVVPYVDVDYGKYKYDEELTYARDKLSQYFNIKWELQQFYSWWPSNIWNFWPVNSKDIKIEYRPDSDHIFKTAKIYTSKEHILFDRNIFRPRDINIDNVVRFDTDQAANMLTRSKSFKFMPTDKDLKILYQLDFNSDICKLSISFKVEINDISFNFSAEIIFRVERLSRIYSNDKYITGDTFYSLAACILGKALRALDRILCLRSRRSGLRLLQKYNCYQVLRISDFEFILPSHKIIKTTFHSLVE